MHAIRLNNLRGVKASMINAANMREGFRNQDFSEIILLLYSLDLSSPIET